MSGATGAVAEYKSMVVQAWSGMLALLLMMFISDLLRLFMLADFETMAQALAVDPGGTGLAVLTAMACFNVLLQMVLRTFDSPALPKFVFWASVAYTGFFMLHQVAHLAGGEDMGVHSLLDFTHHALGVWACWAARRWASPASAMDAAHAEDAQAAAHAEGGSSDAEGAAVSREA